MSDTDINPDDAAITAATQTDTPDASPELSTEAAAAAPVDPVERDQDSSPPALKTR